MKLLIFFIIFCIGIFGFGVNATEYTYNKLSEHESNWTNITFNTYHNLWNGSTIWTNSTHWIMINKTYPNATRVGNSSVGQYLTVGSFADPIEEITLQKDENEITGIIVANDDNAGGSASARLTVKHKLINGSLIVHGGASNSKRYGQSLANNIELVSETGSLFLGTIYPSNPPLLIGSGNNLVMWIEPSKVNITGEIGANGFNVYSGASLNLSGMVLPLTGGTVPIWTLETQVASTGIYITESSPYNLTTKLSGFNKEITSLLSGDKWIGGDLLVEGAGVIDGDLSVGGTVRTHLITSNNDEGITISSNITVPEVGSCFGVSCSGQGDTALTVGNWLFQDDYIVPKAGQSVGFGNSSNIIHQAYITDLYVYDDIDIADRMDCYTSNSNNLCISDECINNWWHIFECWDGIDNDRDGLIDNLDPNCYNSTTKYFQPKYSEYDYENHTSNPNFINVYATGAVNRNAIFVAGTNYTQNHTSTTELSINFTNVSKIDTDYYSHSYTTPDEINILQDGWYRIDYCLNWLNKLVAGRIAVKAYIELDGVELERTYSQAYIRHNTYARYGTTCASTIQELTAGSTLEVHSQVQEEAGNYGETANGFGLDPTGQSWIQIEKISE